MILVNLQRYIVGKIMRTPIYNWLLKDIIPYIRFTTYYTHPTNKNFPKWGALANLGYGKLKPGHIILTVDEKKLTTMLISRFTGEEGFSHAAQCIAKDGEFEIAEMTHTNFTKSTWYDLCYESTRVVILECEAYDEKYIQEMIKKTPEFENTPYDNMFQMGIEALSCAELCYMYDKDRRMKINLEPVLGSDNPLASLPQPVGKLVAHITEETDMTHYCGIDLHSNNHVVVVIDDEDKRVYEKRLANDLTLTMEALSPYRKSLHRIAVESTFNWYWLVDGLQDAGFQMELVNTAAVKQYDGLKYSDDQHDAFWLAHCNYSDPPAIGSGSTGNPAR